MLMEPTRTVPYDRLITTATPISLEVMRRWHRRSVASGSTLMALLLLFGACAQNTEPQMPASKDALSSVQSSPAPASLAQERALRHDGAGALRRETFSSLPYHYPRVPIIPPSTDRFPAKEPAGVLSVAEHPVSTFSVDVDTASYAFVRRNLVGGRMPPREAVRVEDRKSTRLNSSHSQISYAVFCLKKKKKE